MNKDELAAMLNGRERGSEMTEQESRIAKDAGLVVVFGHSDDCMELRGAIDDECYGSALVDHFGLLPNRNGIDDDAELETYFQRKKIAKQIDVNWCADDRPIASLCWTFDTAIPHATFDIMDDGEPWCRGIVFDKKDLS